MRSKESERDYARGRCDSVESGSVTRWKKALTGGPHLSATQGVGPLCQWKKRGEARGVGLLSSRPRRELGRAGKRGGGKRTGQGGGG